AAYEAKKNEWIATLPFGYADGWQRRYGQGYALVDGKRCPFVGRVCMDQCMISLPEYYPEGTKVTLVGESGQERISLESIADEVDTIAYEIACLFTDRLPRKYSS
ncbi:MAG: alanine racemase, partial [Clostridia bacterium]|nr:alanine racemase [Clostridia bacterium]